MEPQNGHNKDPKHNKGWILPTVSGASKSSKQL